jgi:hypothetical protein
MYHVLEIVQKIHDIFLNRFDATVLMQKRLVVFDISHLTRQPASHHLQMMWIFIHKFNVGHLCQA